MYQHLYSRFLKANPGLLHFAAHSHYPWPDVTREATLEYWDVSVQRTDRKWSHFYQQVVPVAQQHVCERIGTSHPQQIAFAPNTHEFVGRIFSCLPIDRPVEVLTTDSEFHSFSRQMRRWMEDGRVNAVIVATDPIDDFENRFIAAAQSKKFDLIFTSHVFFNSGYCIQDPGTFFSKFADQADIIVADGYHGFAALPVDLSKVEDKIFYLGGGYKYAQSGEGICFLHVPPGCRYRPRNTGWFAGFDEMEGEQDAEVKYNADGSRFAGATFDFTGMYRFNAVMKLFAELGLDKVTLHGIIRKKQQLFLDLLEEAQSNVLNSGNLLFRRDRTHGHFLAFEAESAEAGEQIAAALLEKQVYVDVRAKRIRFGFGLYQNDEDLVELFRRLRELSF